MAKRKKKKSPVKLSNLQNMNDDNSPQLGSLGETSLNEGKILGRMTKAGMTIRYESAPCTCGGENSNCFKCDGGGYYRREIVEKMKHESSVAVSNPRGRRPQDFTESETRFSNDARGGEYGIRESGRFASNPLHDDHDN
jgi:hypothetical protein